LNFRFVFIEICLDQSQNNENALSFCLLVSRNISMKTKRKFKRFSLKVTEHHQLSGKNI